MDHERISETGGATRAGQVDVRGAYGFTQENSSNQSMLQPGSTAYAPLGPKRQTEQLAPGSAALSMNATMTLHSGGISTAGSNIRPMPAPGVVMPGQESVAPSMYRPNTFSAAMPPQPIALPRGGSMPPQPIGSTPLSTTRSMSSAQQPQTTQKAEAIDIEKLTDAISGTGVDLKEETDNILRHEIVQRTEHSHIPTTDRSKQQTFLNPVKIKDTIQKIAKKNRLNVHEDVYTYLALAAQERVRSLVEQMTDAKNHRVNSDHLHPPPVGPEGRPMYKEIIHDDVRSQVFAMQKAEAEEDRKREEKLSTKRKPDREEPERQDTVEDAPLPPPPKRRKREKAAKESSSKHVSEDVMKKITNQTALSAVGGLTKSWMLTAMDPPPITSSAATTTPAVLTSQSASTSRGRGRGRPSVRGGKTTGGRGGSGSTSVSADPQFSPRHANSLHTSVSVKDAIHALESDRRGGSNANKKILLKSYFKYLR